MGSTGGSMIDLGELIVDLSALGVYPPSSGGGGTVTSVGTGTGLTGGTITTTGTISLATVIDGALLANISGATAAPSPNTLSAVMDHVLGNLQGSVIFRGATEWQVLPPPEGANYFLMSQGSAADVVWSIPADVDFNANATLYFGVGGDDANPGTINRPFLTLGFAVTQAETLIVGGTPFVTIVGLGQGTSTDNISITQSGITINAPGYILSPATGDALTIDVSGKLSPSFFDIYLASASAAGGSLAVNLLGTTPGSDSVERFTFIGAVDGDVSLVVDCEFYANIITGAFNAAQAGTNVIVQQGIGSQSDQSRLNLEGFVFGAGGGAIHGSMNATNVWRYPQRKIINLTGDRTLGFSDSGYLFINSSSSTYTITLPDTTGQGSTAFLLGYEATFLNVGTGAIDFIAGGSATLTGSTILNRVAQRANCTLITTNSWEVDNEQTYMPSDVCVSQLWGSDTYGNGTPDNPYATLNAALTSLGGSPASITNIKILDNETYNETLDFTGVSNVNLIGQQASLIYSSTSADAITTNSPLMTIDLFELSATGGGKSLNNTGTGSIHLKETIVSGGDVDNASTGLISIQGDALLVNIPNSGGGTVYYSTNIRSGTDGAGVKGQYPGHTDLFNSPTSLPSVNGQLLIGNTDGSTAWNNYEILQQTFTGSGTYTPTAGMVYCIVEAVGGGGGGGGAATSAAGNAAAAGGGGGGEYVRLVISNADIVTGGGSIAITIGAGGGGGSAGANAGTAGGDTVVGSFTTAHGGNGGFAGNSAATVNSASGGSGGGITPGIGSPEVRGGNGEPGIGLGSLNMGLGGKGGNTVWGFGGPTSRSSTGTTGVGYGSGGAGGSTGSIGSASATAGGAGKNGLVTVVEYILAP